MAPPNKVGYYMLSHELNLTVYTTEDADVILRFKKGQNTLDLNLKNWRALFQQQEEINDRVYKQWHGIDAVESPFLWKGMPASLTDEQLESIIELTSKTPGLLEKLHSDMDVKEKMKLILDAKMASFLIGEKRIRVRFTGLDTQVVVFRYHEETTAVDVLMHLTFDEWSELHRNVSAIERLTHKRWYYELPREAITESSV